MARILLDGREYEVLERVEDIWQRISNATRHGPTIGGRPVLPPGWIVLRLVELDQDVHVQVSRIGLIRT